MGLLTDNSSITPLAKTSRKADGERPESEPVTVKATASGRGQNVGRA